MKLVLEFEGNQLWQTFFFFPGLSEARSTVRGKTSGAMKGFGTFQWTAAVQALSCLVLRAVIAAMRAGETSRYVSGGRSSLAISLDYAISKQVQWLQDMFGVDSKGNLIARRLILRTNPNCKRPGPVILALNEKFLPTPYISIVIEGDKNPSVEKIECLLHSVVADFDRSRLAIKTCEIKQSRAA